MPLLFTRHIDFPGLARPAVALRFGVWQIAEEEWYFRNDLPLSPGEEPELALHKGIRRLEWLAGRWLLHKLTGLPERLPLEKNAFAKPFFLDRPELHCSLSHSHGVVGALLANRNCGCDLQVFVDKMPRLATRFLHPEEEKFILQHDKTAQFDLMHVYWTAKESLYKAYGLKELDFRTQLRVGPFSWNGHSTFATARINKENLELDFRLYFEKNELANGGAFVWTVCIPEKKS